MSWLQEIMIQCPQCGEEFAIQIETAEDGIVEMIEAWESKDAEVHP